MRLSAGRIAACGRRRAGRGSCPSSRAAIVWLKMKALNAKRPPGRNEAATRSKTSRFSCQAWRWRSERKGRRSAPRARGAGARGRHRAAARAAARRSAHGRSRASPATSRSRAGLARLAHDLDRDAAAADHQLDDRAVGLPCEPEVVRDVLGHVGGPRVVDGRPGVVFAHRGSIQVDVRFARFAFTQPRLVAGASAR